MLNSEIYYINVISFYLNPADHNVRFWIVSIEKYNVLICFRNRVIKITVNIQVFKLETSQNDL